MGVVNRILWNSRAMNDIDEIVIDHPASVHVEQMDDDRWWIGIYLEDEDQTKRWAGEFMILSDGQMTFYEMDSDVEWERDEEHETEEDES